MIEIIDNLTDFKTLTQKFHDFAVNGDLDLTFIDLTEQNFNLVLNFNLAKQGIVKINYFCLNSHNYLKKIQINTYHEVANTKSYIRFHGIGFDKAKTNLQLDSYNNVKNLDNIYSEQEIIQVNFDDAFFSGLPQIDAKNNSFSSAHKLLVGYINQKELFFLLSLGINYEKSVKILLETLYKAFLSDEDIARRISEAIENVRRKR